MCVWCVVVKARRECDRDHVTGFPLPAPVKVFRDFRIVFHHRPHMYSYTDPRK